MLSNPTHDPIEDVEEAVAAKRNEVEAVDDSRDRGLAQEEELREDADGLEDDGEGPEELACHIVSTQQPLLSAQQSGKQSKHGIAYLGET